MKANWVPAVSALVGIFSLAGLFADRELSQSPETPEPKQPSAEKPAFELKDGDRVVLLGGTMIEREQRFGEWEYLMTTRFPDRKITFRNLGWSGDTIWAESRGIFDSPAEGYRRMIEQVKELKRSTCLRCVLVFGASVS